VPFRLIPPQMCYPKTMRPFLIPIFLATIFLPPTTEARTLFVSPDGDGTTGGSWETAYNAIGNAVVVAASGDKVWVRYGVYNETLNIEKSILLLGGFLGEEAVRRKTIEKETVISAEGLEFPVVKIGSDATIDGFTLRDSDRAGMTIHGNASAIVSNCRITDNIPGGGFGGGVVVFGSVAHFTGCEFTNNWAIDAGGGIEIRRGVTSGRGSDVTMEDCIISGNRNHRGGGMNCFDSSLTMRRCIVAENTAISGGEFGSGPGGIQIGGEGVVRIEDCLVYGNRANRGDQITVGTCEVPAIFQNCTIVSDNAGIVWDDIAPVFRSCILWGSTSIFERAQGAEGDPVVAFSCIQGGYEGPGNISVDPLFVDEAGEDFHLQPQSPCLDTADTEGPSDDLDGNPRPRDLFGVGRDGPGAFDMGAYEFQLPSADLNGDGETNMLDLLILDRQWYSVSGVR